MMKKVTLKYFYIFSLLGLFISAEAISQSSYVINKDVSKMIILGTSSLHNWKMEVTDMNCSTTLVIDGKSIQGVQNAWFSCNPTSIISDYKIMNNKTYEALKAEEFPEIHFRMSDGEIYSVTGNRFNGSVTGYLAVAGQTNEIDIPFQGKLYESGQVELEGKVDLKMSEFDIDPPTAFLGSLRTGDEVSIFYSLKLEINNINESISEVKTKSNIGD